MKHAVKHIHFVGIGGSGMSAIAEVLHNLGYRCPDRTSWTAPHCAVWRGWAFRPVSDIRPPMWPALTPW